MASKEYWRARYEKDFKPAYDALMKFYPFTLEDLDGEEWKPFGDYYNVSNFGRVKSFFCGRGKIIKPILHKNGYIFVTLIVNETKKIFSVHSLVAKLFVANTNNKKEVDHRYGMKLDNYYENLEWVTSTENKKRAVEMGLMSSGDLRYNSKLSSEQVQFIRQNAGAFSVTQLAKLLGVGKGIISQAQRGKTYLNIGGKIRGKINPSSLRIPEAVRIQIRKEYIPGKRGCGSHTLAKKYGLSQSSIMKILREVT